MLRLLEHIIGQIWEVIFENMLKNVIVVKGQSRLIIHLLEYSDLYCDVSATFMRNRREFDVKLEKINLTRCYEVRLMTVAMVTAVMLQPPRLKRLSPSLKKE